MLECRRIIECFGLEGTFKGHLIQPLCNEQGHLQLDQVAQSPIQPGLGSCPARDDLGTGLCAVYWMIAAFLA